MAYAFNSLSKLSSKPIAWCPPIKNHKVRKMLLSKSESKVSGNKEKEQYTNQNSLADQGVRLIKKMSGKSCYPENQKVSGNKKKITIYKHLH